MKTKGFILCFVILLLLHHPAYAKFPLHIGGFKLGDDIINYHHLINMKTCREIAFNQYLAEGETIAQQGFKSGLIAYGLCDKPKKIVRIKLKFADPSKKFFKTLLNKYKEQLGPPNEYKGDPFQTLIAWKWSFTNEQNETISLILQHNVMNEEEKIGTAVKMTLTSQLEREKICFMKQFPEKKKLQPQPGKNNNLLWDRFVPY